jgi:hypothetical protein
MPAISKSIGYGTFPILSGEVAKYTGVGQLDTLSAEWYDDPDGGISFFRGGLYTGYTSLYVDDLNLAPAGGDATKITVSCLGLLPGSGEKRLRRVSAFGQEVSVGPVTYESTEIVGIDTDGDGLPDEAARELVEALRTITTPSGIGKRWLISEPMLGVVDTYFKTSAPDTTQIGTAQTPPSPPPNPAYIWAGYGDALRFSHPYGWVLEDRAYEQPFTGLYIVTDTYAFKHPARPD